MKLSELAKTIGGRLIGGGDIEIHSASSIEEAKKGQITFLAFHGYREQVRNTQASAIIVVSPIEDCKAAQIISADPYLAFARAMQTLYPAKAARIGKSAAAHIDESAKIHESAGIHPFAYIGENTTIGENTVVHPHVFIGDDCTIGADCVIHSHVSIREGTKIGDRVIIQNGARIGSDGYGFAKDEAGRHIKIPQIGDVMIGDDVEIGANTCIDRATLTHTLIGDGAKFDNLVQVGHNCHIGEDALLVAQVGLAGSVVVGKGATLAGQVGVSGHLTIGQYATVGGKSGVTRDVAAEEVYTGYPAMPHSQWAFLQRALRALSHEQAAKEESEEEA